MFKVIGIEGSFDKDVFTVAWGAAVVANKDHLIDPINGKLVSSKKISELVEEKHITLIDRPIEVKDISLIPKALAELVVLLINRQIPITEAIMPSTGRTGGVVFHSRTKEISCYVFKDIESFRLYCKNTLDIIIQNAIYEELELEDRVRLLRLAFILDSRNPNVNALRVYLEYNNQERARKLLKANVKREDLAKFDLLLDACTKKDALYKIKYEGPVTQDGGLDMDIVGKISQGFNGAHARASAHLINQYPFLRKPSSPRLREMRAASAELNFSTNIKGHSLGDRIARYLELEFLQQVIKGGLPPELSSDVYLEQSIQKIIEIAPKTKVEQKSLGSDIPEIISNKMALPDSDVFTKEITVFGFQSGLINQALKIELQLFPTLKFLVPTTKDADFDTPKGIDYLYKDYTFLFKPAIFTLIKQTNRRTQKESLHLSRVEWIEKNLPYYINALPSSILPGAFLVNLNIDIKQTSNSLISSKIGEVSDLGSQSLSSARQWIKHWAALAYEFELNLARRDDTEWLCSIKKHEHTAIERILVCLHRAGGRASISDLIVSINKEFSDKVRINNTRREVSRNPSLVDFDPNDSKAVFLTEKGELHAQAFMRAMGILQATSALKSHPLTS